MNRYDTLCTSYGAPTEHSIGPRKLEHNLASTNTITFIEEEIEIYTMGLLNNLFGTKKERLGKEATTDAAHIERLWKEYYDSYELKRKLIDDIMKLLREKNLLESDIHTALDRLEKIISQEFVTISDEERTSEELLCDINAITHLIHKTWKFSDWQREAHRIKEGDAAIHNLMRTIYDLLRVELHLLKAIKKADNITQSAHIGKLASLIWDTEFEALLPFIQANAVYRIDYSKQPWSDKNSDMKFSKRVLAAVHRVLAGGKPVKGKAAKKPNRDDRETAQFIAEDIIRSLDFNQNMDASTDLEEIMAKDEKLAAIISREYTISKMTDTSAREKKIKDVMNALRYMYEHAEF